MRVSVRVRVVVVVLGVRSAGRKLVMSLDRRGQLAWRSYKGAARWAALPYVFEFFRYHVS